MGFIRLRRSPGLGRGIFNTKPTLPLPALKKDYADCIKYICENRASDTSVYAASNNDRGRSGRLSPSHVRSARIMYGNAGDVNEHSGDAPTAASSTKSSVSNRLNHISKRCRRGGCSMSSRGVWSKTSSRFRNVAMAWFIAKRLWQLRASQRKIAPIQRAASAECCRCRPSTRKGQTPQRSGAATAK